MYLGTNLDKVFYEYTITMTEEERKEIQDTLIADASELRLGINMKDPSLVPHIANDSCQTFEGVWHPPSKGQSHNQSTGGWSFLIRTCICDIEIEPSLLPL